MSKNRSARMREMTNEDLIRQLVDCEKGIRIKLNNNPETKEDLNLLKTLYIERQDLLSELDWRDISGEI